MTDPNEPRAAESMPVQLTRMEGILLNVAEKVSDLRGVVAQHDADISNLKMSTQQLRSDANSREQTVVATAKALAEAKTAEEAAARAAANKAALEAAKSDQTWSPLMRLGVALGALASLVLILAYLFEAKP